MKKTIIKRNDMNFQCSVTFDPSLHGYATVSVKQILYPNRKFFRIELFSKNYHFFLGDYNSVMDCIDIAVDRYLQEESKRLSVNKKISDFETGFYTQNNKRIRIQILDKDESLIVLEGYYSVKDDRYYNCHGQEITYSFKEIKSFICRHNGEN